MQFKALLILITISQLSACTVVPGQHMSRFSTQSSIEMPVTENNETILKKLNIKYLLKNKPFRNTKVLSA